MQGEQTRQSSLIKSVKCLESEQTFYNIAVEILGYAEEYLHTSHGYILQKDGEDSFYNVIIQYADTESGFIRERCEVMTMCVDNTITGSISQPQYASILQRLDARSFICSPIAINGAKVMYLLILEKEDREFTETEVAFVHDIAIILQTIAQKKVFSQSAASTNEILRDILANIGAGIAVFDGKSGKLLFKNQIAEYSEENIRVLDDAMRSVIQNEYMVPKRTTEFFDAESGLWFDVDFSRLKWIDGRDVILAAASDTTLKKKNSTKSTFQAQNDFLTGLYNRMKCEIDLKKIIDYTLETNQKGAVLFLDLDNFKNINDSLGHDYGDALLKEIGTTLQGIMGLRNHCYRMGGDEFVAIITPENYGMLQKIVTSASAAFNRAWYLIDSECYCTMSMGIVEFPEHGQDVNTLIKKADISMYEAKKSGKNRYNFYTGNESDEAIRKLEVESSMRQAVEDRCEEFVVYYQPIVDTSNNKCTGCESLVRWDSKSLGFVGPGEFIPMAEYLGLIMEIGDFVLETACRQCKEWNEKYDPDFRINVNLSVVQLLQKNVVEHINGIILDSGVNPQNITLEITENLAINDIERVTDIMDGLKKIGIKIALDDFGTGYSSLNYIKQLDFDIIKIDKSFVDQITSDEYEKAFVKLIVDLSKQIGVKLCVEGIETKEQYEILKDLEADSIQGYFFGRPVPAKMFEEEFFIKENLTASN